MGGAATRQKVSKALLATLKLTSDPEALGIVARVRLTLVCCTLHLCVLLLLLLLAELLLPSHLSPRCGCSWPSGHCACGGLRCSTPRTQVMA